MPPKAESRATRFKSLPLTSASLEQVGAASPGSTAATACEWDPTVLELIPGLFAMEWAEPSLR
jgi:hypothetical protein